MISSKLNDHLEISTLHEFCRIGLFAVIFWTARCHGSSTDYSQEILHYFFSIINWHYIYLRGVGRFFCGGWDPTRSRTKWALKTRASRGVWGHAPPRKFWKLDCLRLNLVSFEGSMIWKRQPIAMLLKMLNLKMNFFFWKIRITIRTANHHDLSIAYQAQAS